MKKILIAVFFFGLLFTLHAQDNLILKYRNVLNIRNIPADSKDLTSFAFFDLGSWFGFALPDEEQKEFFGSFPGPYVVSDGVWLSKSFIKFNMKDANSGKEFDFSEAKLAEISYYPGILTQKFILDNIYIELYLIFI
jgi:putative isomerase